MAITLGTFKVQNDKSYLGTIKTLTANAELNIVPAKKHSDNAPDYRVYTRSNCEIGAGWSQVAKTSGETYVNLKIATPEFGPNMVRVRLVKMAQANEVGATHVMLWEPKEPKD